MTKQRKGFHLLSPEERRRMARIGGKAAHALKTGAHEWTQEEAQVAGRKGGRISAARRKQKQEASHVPGADDARG